MAGVDRPPTRAAAVANNALVCPVGTIYAGFAVRETTGNATARVDVFDGPDATGTLLDTIPLNPGEDDTGTVANVIYADDEFVAEHYPHAIPLPDGPGSPSVGWTTPAGGQTWVAPVPTLPPVE